MFCSWFQWYPEVTHHCPNIPIILIATKVDMRNSNNKSTVGNKKMISYKEGLALSRQIKAKHYIECSAKTIENVKEVFDAAIKTVLIPCSKDKQDHKKRRCSVL